MPGAATAAAEAAPVVELDFKAGEIGVDRRDGGREDEQAVQA